MSNKSKFLYKLITIITLGAPLPIYLFLSATLFNINPDYEIRNIEHSEVLTLTVDEYTLIYSNAPDAVYNGVVVNHDGVYGFYMDEDDILKLDDGYFNRELENIKVTEIKKQLSYKLPLTFIISLFGVGIVAAIVSKKMEWYKKYPRTATLISLVTVTALLFVLNTFISNILNVFMIASASWAVYCIEYMVNNNHISQTTATKTESDVISALKEALK